jgi:hypothetical protein
MTAFGAPRSESHEIVPLLDDELVVDEPVDEPDDEADDEADVPSPPEPVASSVFWPTASIPHAPITRAHAAMRRLPTKGSYQSGSR